MQNIYVYDPYGKVGKLIWYKGRAFYSYVVTYNHSYEFLYNGLIDGRAVINCTVYNKDEIKHSLHDGAIEPGSCPDNHGWWFSSDNIKIMKCLPPLASLIERRQQWK